MRVQKVHYRRCVAVQVLGPESAPKELDLPLHSGNPRRDQGQLTPPIRSEFLGSTQILALEKQAAIDAEGVMTVSSYVRAKKRTDLSHNGCMPSPLHAGYHLIRKPKVCLKAVLCCRAMHPTLHRITPWPITPTWPSPAQQSTPFTQPASPTPATCTSPMTRPSAGAYRSYSDSTSSESPLCRLGVTSLALHLQHIPKIPAILV